MMYRKGYATVERRGIESVSLPLFGYYPTLNIVGIGALILSGIAALLVILADAALVPSTQGARSIIMGLAFCCLGFGVILHRRDAAIFVTALTLMGAGLYQPTLGEAAVTGVDSTLDAGLLGLVFLGLSGAALLHRLRVTDISALRQNVFGMMVGGGMLAIFWFYPELPYLPVTLVWLVGASVAFSGLVLLSLIPIRLGAVIVICSITTAGLTVLAGPIGLGPALGIIQNCASWIGIITFSVSLLLTRR